MYKQRILKNSHLFLNYTKNQHSPYTNYDKILENLACIIFRLHFHFRSRLEEVEDGGVRGSVGRASCTPLPFALEEASLAVSSSELRSSFRNFLAGCHVTQGARNIETACMCIIPRPRNWGTAEKLLRELVISLC